MYLLDTNVLSALRKLSPDHRLVHWLGAQDPQDPQDTFISTITVMEIERGIQKKRRVDTRFANKLEAWLLDNIAAYGDRVLPITTAISRRWGRLQIELRRADTDIPIAATALEHNLTVVTRNVRHFDKTGAAILNPFDSP